MNAAANDLMTDRYPIGDSPEVSAQVRKELIDSLVASTGVTAEQVEAELAQRDFASSFERYFSHLDLSRGDLADVFTAQLIALWSIVHDTNVTDRSIAAAVRRQMASSLRGREDVADPVRRQLVGEALLFESVLSLESCDQARASGNRAQLREMAESAQHNMLNRQALNLKKMRLTAAGMQRV
jgi:hypothetical protein